MSYGHGTKQEMHVEAHPYVLDLDLYFKFLLSYIYILLVFSMNIHPTLVEWLIFFKKN